MWIPLAFWAVHRAVDEGSWKFGTLAGVFVWLQTLSCVYYGLFLALMAAALAMLLLATDIRHSRAALRGLVLGAIVAAALIWPYAGPYLENAHVLGPRDPAEIARYSARPINYLASPPQNWLWGWTADRFGANETRLFPGAVAMLLALCASAFRPRRPVWVYAGICALAVELSFGVNGWLYGWLYAHAGALHGLRAPARFAILVSSALAVMAGLGVAALDRLRGARGPRMSAAAIALALLALEYVPSRMFLMELASGPPDVYTVISGMGAGVVAELPMPVPGRLPGYDARPPYPPHRPGAQPAPGAGRAMVRAHRPYPARGFPQLLDALRRPAPVRLPDHGGVRRACERDGQRAYYGPILRAQPLRAPPRERGHSL